MKQEALSSLVRIKVDGIQSHRKHYKLVKGGKGTRHIKGHICTGPGDPKAAAPQSDADD